MESIYNLRYTKAVGSIQLSSDNMFDFLLTNNKEISILDNYNH